MLGPSRAGYVKTLSPLFWGSFAGTPREKLSAPAGTFEGCSKLEHTITFAELDGASTLWLHPSVPLTGLVRATLSSGEATIELVDFAAQGARTSMKRRG
jgi:hypothetical protein